MPIHLKAFSLQQDAPYDIYHDPRVDEVVKCRSLLDNLCQRVRQLLVEWPENPILQQILDVVERVLRFPVTSPLIKFVTGLELVLGKSEDWERNAHQGVSLISHLDEMRQLVISWRKLELKCWENCLEVIAYDVDKATNPWWFHMYVLLESALKKEDDEMGPKMASKDFLKAVQTLMEDSSLGKYAGRLRIVLAFHCQLIHEQQNRTSRFFGDVLKELTSITWNCYRYYCQFEEGVKKKLTDLRTPIAKEVKQFVRIAQWSDKNFWTTIEAVEKSHRTLPKQMQKLKLCSTRLGNRFLLIRRQRVRQVARNQPYRLVSFVVPMEVTATVGGLENCWTSTSKVVCENQESQQENHARFELPRRNRNFRRLRR